MRLVEKLGLVLLVALIVLGSLVVYLQTSHGFRHVIVPLSEKFTGATFEVHDGMLTLAGFLYGEGLRYEDPNAGRDRPMGATALSPAQWEHEGARRRLVCGLSSLHQRQ